DCRPAGRLAKRGVPGAGLGEQSRHVVVARAVEAEAVFGQDLADRVLFLKRGRHRFLPSDQTPGRNLAGRGPGRLDWVGTAREAAAMVQSASPLALYASVGPELTHYSVDVEAASLERHRTVSLPAHVHYCWPHASRRFLYVASSD